MGTVGLLVGIMLFSPFSHAVQCHCNAFYLAVLILAPHDVEQIRVLAGGRHVRS